MGQFVDLKGIKIGRLRVLKIIFIKNRSIYWECLCDCGKVTNVKGGHLTSRATKSCGCFQKERASQASRKHGMSNTVEFSTWRRMINRCCNKRCQDFSRYGGRGIKVCDRWLKSFNNFFKDMGKRPSESHSIERENNSGNYEPSNCIWATMSVQCNNTSRNRILNINGDRKTMSQWCRIHKIRMKNVWYRLNAGWNPERALTIPIRAFHYHH